MPGFTPHLSLRYPLINETVTAQSYQDLANDIDTQFSVTDVLRQLNLHKSSASVATGTGTSVASATTVNILFNTSNWTIPAALHSTVSNQDQFVIQTPGLYYFAAALGTGGSFTTFTGFQVGLSKNAASNTQHTGRATSLGGTAQAKSLYACNAGDILRAYVRWSGTGGPATFTGQAFLCMLAQL